MTATVLPDLQVRWKSNAGDARPAKNDWMDHVMNDPHEEVHTAVHSYVPQKYKGLTCNLRFRLSQDDWIVDSGYNSAEPAKFDIYHLNGCLNEAYTWQNKLTRGIKAGVIAPTQGDMADWESVGMTADNETEPSMPAAHTFICSPDEFSPGANIGWNDARKGGGLSIEVHRFDNDILIWVLM